MYPGLTDRCLEVCVVAQSDLYTFVHVLVTCIKIIIPGFGQILLFFCI